MSFQNMFRALNISGSGLSAERTRMNVIAHNIANANTLKTRAGGPYKRKEVLFSAVMDKLASRGQRSGASALGGVDVMEIVESKEPLKKVYDPSSAFADKSGYVRMPNVNVVREMIDMISASRAYEANLAVAKAGKDIVQSTLSLGK